MSSPLPLSIKLTVLTVIMSENIVPFMMPTVVVYMVERLGNYNSSLGSDFQSVSYWVGLLEGSNRLFALFGGIIWGAISDKIGRRSSLIYIIIGIGLSSLGVGLSSSLYSILCWRILAGFLAGTIPIMKALMRDLSDDSNISVLYSYFGTGYGAASIIGPLIGGLLSSPRSATSLLFSNPVISAFPYFYPFFIHFLVTLLALVLILKCIPHSKQTGRQGSQPGKYSFLHEKDYLVSSFIFILIAVVQFSYRALVTLWLRLDPRSGGIGWDTEVNPGIMNSLSGFIVMFAPLMLTDTLQQKFGVRKACSLVALGLVFPLLLVSLASAMDGWTMWAYLVLMNGLAVALTSIMVSIVSIAVSNSVLSGVAGTALGITQAVVAFSRAIGNGGTAFLFGVLQSEGFEFPFDFHLLFGVNVVVLGAVVVLFFVGLDSGIEKRKKVDVEIPLLSKG